MTHIYTASGVTVLSGPHDENTRADTILTHPSDMRRTSIRSQAADDGDAAAFRTYLRLVHSFLQPGNRWDDARGMFNIVGQGMTRDRLPGWRVQTSDLHSSRRLVQENIYSENWCLRHFEIGLHMSMREHYYRENCETPAIFQFEFEKFGDMDYAGQIAEINRAHRRHTESIDIQARLNPEFLPGPGVEANAVRNLLALNRLPTPGLRLSSMTLESQLPDGQWVIRLHPKAEDTLTMKQINVFLHCREYALKRAGEHFIENRNLAGRHHETAWEWLPFGERQAWLEQSIGIIQAEHVIATHGQAPIQSLPQSLPQSPSRKPAP